MSVENKYKKGYDKVYKILKKDIIYSGTKALKDYDKLFAQVGRNKVFGNNSEQ